MAEGRRRGMEQASSRLFLKNGVLCRRLRSVLHIVTGRSEPLLPNDAVESKMKSMIQLKYSIVVRGFS